MIARMLSPTEAFADNARKFRGLAEENARIAIELLTKKEGGTT